MQLGGQNLANVLSCKRLQWKQNLANDYSGTITMETARWKEAIHFIDFSHSGRKARGTINELIGRSGRSSCMCPVSANSIASLEEQDTRLSCESTRLINKQLSDLWKVPTLKGNSISGPFRPELAAALSHLKPGKSPGLDSIFLFNFILHAGWTLKSWFCDFLTISLLQVKITKIWALIVAIPKPESHWGTQRAITLCLLLASTPRSFRDSSTFVSTKYHRPNYGSSELHK